MPYRDHRNGGELTGFSDEKFKLRTVLDYLASERLLATSEAATKDAGRWRYPALAKPESDGPYCYNFQRRISVWFSVRLAGRMGANTATGLDLIFGVLASLLVLLDHWLWGVVLIQAFGIFSCVDGEIARIQGRVGFFPQTARPQATHGKR